MTVAAGWGPAADPTDIDTGDWVGRWLPGWAEPYARLARLDRPIGTWLLLFPAWWGIALASPRRPDPVLLALFALGAVAMRGAGCTLNDIADREYDGKVARTRLQAAAERAGDVCRRRSSSCSPSWRSAPRAPQPQPRQHPPRDRRPRRSSPPIPS